MERILFINWTRIGDAVLATGALEHLLASRPEARFTIACGPIAAPLFEAFPRLDAIWEMPKLPRDGHWIALWRKARPVRWDLAVDMRGSAVTWFLRAKERRVWRARKGLHKADEAAAALGIAASPPTKVYVPQRAKDWAAAAMPGTQPILVLSPGATWAGKRWPPQRFSALGHLLAGGDGPLAGARIALLAGPGEEALSAAVAAGLAGVSVTDFTAKLDLLQAQALLERAALFVGNDSGLMHMAAAAHTPSIGMFGPTDERIYGPFGPRALAVRGPKSFEQLSALDPEWRGDQSLMLDLTPERVAQAAQDLLQKAVGGVRHG